MTSTGSSPLDSEDPDEEPQQATRPIGPDQVTQAFQTPTPNPVKISTVASSCRSGHDQPSNPTWHPTLGLVPAMSSVIFGVIVLLVVLGLQLWLLPLLLGWTIALLLFGLLLSAIAQLALGHRGQCWLWRTLRWWIGPVGTLVDPIEMG